MLNEKVASALNEQLNAELYSAYLYYSMSAYFESHNLKGIAGWFRVQTQEEMAHAHKFYTYINDRNAKVALTAIEQPPATWKTPLAAFEDAYKHEQMVTQRIGNLIDLSTELKDHATHNYLQWFLTEQVEEEATASDLVEKLKLIGENSSGLFFFDHELGTRAFAPGSE